MHLPVSEFSQQLIHLLDRDGNFLYANQAYCRFSGYALDELKSKNITSIDPIFSKELVEQSLALIEDGQPFIFSTQHVLKSGESANLEVMINAAEWQGKTVFYASAIPVKENNNRDVIYKDYTAQNKALLKSKSWLKLSDQNFHAIDIHGNLIEHSNSFLKMLGYSEEEAIHLKVSDWVVDEDPLAASKRLTQMLSNKNDWIEFNLIFKTKQNILIDVELRAVAFDYHNKTMLFCSCKNISDRKILERQKEKALSELEEKNKNQARLYSIIGHELRTPATVINMMLQEEDVDIELIRSSSAHLLNVIEDMAVVTRPDLLMQGKLSNCSIKQVVHDAVNFQERLLPGTSFNIHIDLLPIAETEFLINAQLLRQIVMNIVQNAFLHSGGNNLYVSLEKKAESGRLFRLNFADDGRGVAAEFVPDIFVPYERGDSSAGGSGLGLHLCQSLAKTQLNGNISYHPSPHGGAMFTVDFEVFPVARFDRSAKSSCPKTISGLRVLLVEDSDTIRILTAGQLRNRGAIVMEVCDGAKALDYIEKSSFDAVLTDIFMPNLNGFELTRMLREQGFTSKIVAVTAATIGNEVDQMLSAGADLVLNKPINIDEVIDAIGIEQGASKTPLHEVITQEIDLERICSSVDHDMELLKSLILGFQVDVATLMFQFEDAYNSRNVESLKRLIHKTKGLGQCLFAQRLSAICRKAKCHLNDVDWSAVRTDLNQLQGILESVCSEVEALSYRLEQEALTDSVR